MGMSKDSIAGRTEKAAHFPGCMVMVYIKHSVFRFRPTADSALPVLFSQKALVFLKRHTVLSGEMAFPLIVPVCQIPLAVEVWIELLPFPECFALTGLATRH